MNVPQCKSKRDVLIFTPAFITDQTLNLANQVKLYAKEADNNDRLCAELERCVDGIRRCISIGCSKISTNLDHLREDRDHNEASQICIEERTEPEDLDAALKRRDSFTKYRHALIW